MSIRPPPRAAACGPMPTPPEPAVTPAPGSSATIPVTSPGPIDVGATSPGGIDLTGAADRFQTQAALDEVAQRLGTLHAVDELSKSVVETIFAQTVGVYGAPNQTLSGEVNALRNRHLKG